MKLSNALSTSKLKQNCRRVLYNQPDFADQLSAIEIACKARVLGACEAGVSSVSPAPKEDDLERNVLSALESVPVEIMRKYARRSRRFIDAYLSWSGWEAGCLGIPEV
ncbi:hypothetical protein LshimejAT787_1602800 [Lyophyllum shimeji]|uniref:Uncharacterized protein n=1 Tax=Lyophyllum shimeji TaxID=47721 RepID=A0A9P3UU48_LYOSH|nr:hypothetical protein LshimejAT787_1602800 [Lyophyllum shimeji]